MKNMFKRLFRSHLSVYRNIDGDDLLEVFLVSGITSLLVIRFFLKITNYPKIGNGDLHIAHIVWGGLFMMVAVVILLAFLNNASKVTAAIIGGIGFGAFIDELGKFVTSDNNYFYQPTIALIYAIFILLYLFLRVLDRYTTYSKKEYLINALESLKEAVINDMDDQEQDRTLEYLRRSSAKDPLVVALKPIVEKAEVVEPSRDIIVVLKDYMQQGYRTLISSAWFPPAVILFFVLQSIGVGVFRMIIFYEDFLSLPLSAWGVLLASVLSGVFVIAGIMLFYYNRLNAYLMFKRSVLTSIFLTQFFLFYRDQLTALSWLFINIIALITLDYIIGQEKVKLHKVK